MEPPPSDRAAVRFPPPLVFVAAILVAVAAERRWRALPLGGSDALRAALAAVALAAAAGLIVGALVQFRRSGQNPEPWKPTPELVFAGPYRVTRNPMYLGMALFQVAAALWMASGWTLLLLPAALYGVWAIAIRPEEAYLERKFGDAYRDYERRVRRWL